MVSMAEVVVPQGDGTLMIYQGPVCLAACPSGAISIARDEVVVHEGGWGDCEACVDEFPVGALELI